MGVDLTLIPTKFRRDRDILAYTRIALERESFLFDEIANRCQPRELGHGIGVEWYDDDGIKTETNDPYGDPLTYVTAGDLSRINWQDRGSAWNQAVGAMMKALPPETVVILWWH